MSVKPAPTDDALIAVHLAAAIVRNREIAFQTDGPETAAKIFFDCLKAIQAARKPG